MTSSVGKIFIDENVRVLTREGAASLFGISSATVRNWVKGGYLKTVDGPAANLFHRSDVENVKRDIAQGRLAKLNRRANKSRAGRTFIPAEYVQDKSDLGSIQTIVDGVRANKGDVSRALFLLCLNRLVKENLMSPVAIEDLESGAELNFSNRQIAEEIKSWRQAIREAEKVPEISYFLDCPLPGHRDVLGFIYQSLRREGDKAQSGSYYTPSEIVDDIVGEYVKKDSLVLDPCCGTGQFLLAFAGVVEDPARIYGMDIDAIAVRIARINLLIHYKGKDFSPNVVCKNTLLDNGRDDLPDGTFDVIATNPPWGMHFSQQDVEKLKSAYPHLTSLESFACFLKKSHDLLKDGGLLSFVLPESLLNVKTHKDIRAYILRHSQIKKIVYLNRVFKNVFTPVIRLDVEKTRRRDGEVTVRKDGASYLINQSRWTNNRDYVFDIHARETDAEIIRKIYDTPHVTLEGQADWALGIVTGNNSRYVIDAPQEGYEDVYRGRDVGPFRLGNPSCYIPFTPEKFQQVAPVEKYRAKEKLIYRFISNRLVFACDDRQKLTLNSANVVIPKIPGYPMKTIAALFNSSVYQFIFQKKFSSIKVLRSHLERLPLPLWDGKTLTEIAGMVDEVIRNPNAFAMIDEYVMDKYGLSGEEKDSIKFSLPHRGEG